MSIEEPANTNEKPAIFAAKDKLASLLSEAGISSLIEWDEDTKSFYLFLEHYGEPETLVTRTKAVLGIVKSEYGHLFEFDYDLEVMQAISITPLDSITE